MLYSDECDRETENSSMRIKLWHYEIESRFYFLIVNGFCNFNIFLYILNFFLTFVDIHKTRARLLTIN